MIVQEVCPYCSQRITVSYGTRPCPACAQPIRVYPDDAEVLKRLVALGVGSAVQKLLGR